MQVGLAYEVAYESGLDNGVMHGITGTLERRIKFEGEEWLMFGVSLGKFLIREHDILQASEVRAKRGWEL